MYVAGGDATNNVGYAPAGLQPLAPGFLRSLTSSSAWEALAVPDALAPLLLDSSGSNLVIHWDAFLEATAVTACQAAESAGAVYCGPEAHCALVGNSSISESSAAQLGGALHANGAAQVLVADSALSRCTAGQFGGGIYALRVRLNVTVARVALTGHVAAIGGSAAYVTGSLFAASASSFQGNVASGLFPKGGAIFVTDGGSFRAADSALVENVVRPVGVITTTDDMVPQVVQAAGAGSGGVIFAIAAAGHAPVAVSLDRCNVSANAAEKGGAIAVTGAVTVVIRASSFLGNTARFGGVFAVGPGRPNISADEASFFDFNVADVGAISFVNSTRFVPAVNASTIGASNSARNFGAVNATVPTTASVFIPPSAQTNAPVNISVTMTDDFGQRVTEWSDLVVSAQSSDSNFLKLTYAAYGGGSTTFQNIKARRKHRCALIHMRRFDSFGLSFRRNSPPAACLLTPPAPRVFPILAGPGRSQRLVQPLREHLLTNRRAGYAVRGLTERDRPGVLFRSAIRRRKPRVRLHGEFSLGPEQADLSVRLQLLDDARREVRGALHLFSSEPLPCAQLCISALVGVRLDTCGRFEPLTAFCAPMCSPFALLVTGVSARDRQMPG